MFSEQIQCIAYASLSQSCFVGNSLPADRSADAEVVKGQEHCGIVQF